MGLRQTGIYSLGNIRFTVIKGYDDRYFGHDVIVLKCLKKIHPRNTARLSNCIGQNNMSF